MVKVIKFFRKQADKAESCAAHAPDSENSLQLRALADAYRAQADILKQQEKKAKKKK
jgi:hypothetical protein